MNKGFWNGFSYAISYPIEFNKIPETTRELYNGLKSLGENELDRKHTLGFLVGGSLNLAATFLEIGLCTFVAVPYAITKSVGQSGEKLKWEK